MDYELCVIIEIVDLVRSLKFEMIDGSDVMLELELDVEIYCIWVIGYVLGGCIVFRGMFVI